MVAPALLGNKALLGTKVSVHRQSPRQNSRQVLKTRAASQYAEELVQTAVSGFCGCCTTFMPEYLLGNGSSACASPCCRTALPPRAMDESNATCGKRLESINVDNTEENRRAYRELLVTTPGLGEYISGAIMFEETLYQSTRDGKKFTDVLNSQNIMPGIKVDKGLVPLPNSNNESWCQGLDGLAQRCAEYYKQGARFAKWRSVISIPSGELGLEHHLNGACAIC